MHVVVACKGQVECSDQLGIKSDDFSQVVRRECLVPESTFDLVEELIVGAVVVIQHGSQGAVF